MNRIVYLVINSSCDGNHLGRAWGISGFATMDEAIEKVKESTPEWTGKWNGKSTAGRDTVWQECEVDEKKGLAQWRTGHFVYIEEVVVSFPD